MIEYPIVEFESIAEGLPSAATYNNELLVTAVTNQTETLRLYSRVNALQILVVQKGTAEFQIDYKKYSVSENAVVIIMPTHVVVSARSSSDFKGLLMAASRSFMAFMDHTKTPTQESPEVAYMTIRKNPILQITADESALLRKCLLAMQHNIQLTQHKLHRQLLQNNMHNFLIELANIVYQREEYYTAPTLSRKEELFAAFLKLLIANVRKEHIVSFYSDKLFITPQYLSLILKEQTGKSANKWIDESLIQEAKILLKAPQATVQQVADILHFSDQSTFGKFFKKHMGVSPMEYRKSV